MNVRREDQVRPRERPAYETIVPAVVLTIMAAPMAVAIWLATR
jgi:hypothetical protein